MHVPAPRARTRTPPRCISLALQSIILRNDVCQCKLCQDSNCRGWKSASDYVSNLLSACDICKLQEHWLFNEQLQSLNFNNDFSSVGVSGMTSTDFIAGRPFGGCGILYRKSLSQYITTHRSISKRFCSVTINSPQQSILLICVYLPTNYGTSQSSDQFLESLGELKGFIDTQVYDKVVIAGDFNVDFRQHSTPCVQFMNDLELSAVDTRPGYNINFTYERDDGLAHSWPDHILSLNYCIDDILSVKCVHSPDNFSDHTPLSFVLNVNLYSQ